MARPKGSKNRPRPLDINSDPLSPDASEMRRAEAPLTRREPRRPTRSAPRDVERDTTRHGAVIVTGRNGEKLTRRKAESGDIYFVPPNEIPHGWSYQWNTVSVHGNNEVVRKFENNMFANGWRPVPADRHPGRWTAPGVKGDIVVQGLRLEERPSALTEEATAEDEANARALTKVQQEALGLQKKLPGGFEAGKKYRGTGADVRMTIDPALDIARPSYDIEE